MENILEKIKKSLTAQNLFYAATGLTLFFLYKRNQKLDNSLSSLLQLHQDNVKQLQKQQNQVQNHIEINQQQYQTVSEQQQLQSEIQIQPQLQQQQQQKQEARIIKICITGGPCAGKTSGLSYLAEKLRYDGFFVFVVPEVATMISNGGGMIDMTNYDQNQAIGFQTSLMQTQIQLEDCFLNIAKISNKPSVILCDRGLMDGSVYMEQAAWDNMLKILKKTQIQIRDMRYDAVIHLVTTADGAQEYYNKDNHARHETPLDAIKLDRKLQLAWLGHPRYEIVDNQSVKDFEEKLEKLLYRVRQICGIKGYKKHFFKRYLLDNPEQINLQIPKDIKVEQFFIEDIFISYQSEKASQGQFTKLRRRGQGETWIYILSQSKISKGKQFLISKKMLNYKEYLLILTRSDERRQPLLKERKCFIYDGLQYIIDTYLNVKNGFSILRVKLEDENQQHQIPNFLKVSREVTHEPGYKTKYLSKKNWYVPKGDDMVIIRKESQSDNEFVIEEDQVQEDQQ